MSAGPVEWSQTLLWGSFLWGATSSPPVSQTDAPTGSVAWSGTRTESYSRQAFPGLTVYVDGVTSELRVAADVSVGTITFGSTPRPSHTHFIDQP